MFNTILDYIFPFECIQCGYFGSYFCNECITTLPFSSPETCFGCEREVIIGSICSSCRADFYFDNICIVSHYSHPIMQKLLFEYKFNHVERIGNSLGEVVYRYVSKYRVDKILLNTSVVVTSIPLHIKKQRVRGFNQSEIVAKYLAEKIDISYIDVLKRKGKKYNQHDLSKDEREKAVIDTFEFIGEDIPETVFLIDDVVTTGSTLQEAAYVLKREGVKRVICLVLARN